MHKEEQETNQSITLKNMTPNDFSEFEEKFEEITKKDLDNYEYIMKNRPHVVILGAGASCATIPKGDKNGKKISAMNGFITKLDLTNIISKVKINTKSDNLEDIYMELYERSKIDSSCKKVKEKLEKIIWEDMSAYQLPDKPTIYDFLIMSLTSKDLIATFNWDPLLVQAVTRLIKYTNNVPHIVFLHGNVAAGFCDKDNIISNIDKSCPKCGKTLQPLKLLFPIKNKNYSNDIVIKKAWNDFRRHLQQAYMITIFGYSAPKSDVEAIKIMKEAWGDVSKKNMEEIEIIDIKDENTVRELWSEFIHSHHYSYHTNFFDTTLAKYPRRSCEATFDRLMNCYFLNEDGFKENMTFDDIYKKTFNLITEEKEVKNPKQILSNPYKYNRG